jgi:hypothetical protein
MDAAKSRKSQENVMIEPWATERFSRHWKNSPRKFQSLEIYPNDYAVHDFVFASFL